MAVILDLDLTLVDSSAALDLRRQRRWSDVYRGIPSFAIYDGIRELLEDLTERRLPFCIVTSSPQSYCSRVLDHFEIVPTACVCYHDTQQHKPHPAPIHLGIERLGVARELVISIGDEPRDIIASRAAGVKAYAALWGAADRDALLAEAPDAVFETPQDFHAHLRSVP